MTAETANSQASTYALDSLDLSRGDCAHQAGGHIASSIGHPKGSTAFDLNIPKPGAANAWLLTAEEGRKQEVAMDDQELWEDVKHKISSLPDEEARLFNLGCQAASAERVFEASQSVAFVEAAVRHYSKLRRL